MTIKTIYGKKKTCLCNPLNISTLPTAIVSDCETMCFRDRKNMLRRPKRYATQADMTFSRFMELHLTHAPHHTHNPNNRQQ